jgi:hypothetical protein
MFTKNLLVNTAAAQPANTTVISNNGTSISVAMAGFFVKKKEDG